MDFAADTAEEYRAALAAMERLPIIGTHTIGELTISVSHKRWTVSDLHGNEYGGAVTAPAKVRGSVRTAVVRWMERRFHNVTA